MLTHQVHPEADIDSTVSLGAFCVIGRARIEQGAVIGAGVVIHDDVHIGPNVRIYDNTVLGRRPQVAGVIQRPPKADLPPLTIGAGCVVGANVVLYAGTTIGNNTLIGDLSCIREECRIGALVVIGRSVLLNYNIEIHDRVRIMDGSHFGGDMVVESDVFIGPHVSTANDNTMGLTSGVVRRGPYIRRGASIGVGAILLANIDIGEQAIVAAGALVDRDVPGRKLVLGLPARVVKEVSDTMLKPLDDTNAAEH